MRRPIDLTQIDHVFAAKPLLIGGQAMAYYQLRAAGDDSDFVVSAADYEGLAARYPQHKRDLFGDLGVSIGEFEFWRSILLFDYAALSVGAVEAERYHVVSLAKLLFLKALALPDAKAERDLRLVVQKIHAIQYSKDPPPPRVIFGS
ncbi:MAG: hypothetical protein KDD73_15265 [Anaerolineales bacterium]|nr:hypothetical protein [Anaerolineales bacterium]